MVLRTRLAILAGLLAGAAMVVLRDSLAALWIFIGVSAAAIALAFLAVVRLIEIRRRPPAFGVTGGRFVARLVFPLGALPMIFLASLGSTTRTTLDSLTDGDSAVQVMGLFHLAATVLVAIFVVALSAFVWILVGLPIVELTPEGVMSRNIWHRRFIPWEALSPGGPLRPHRNAAAIRLVYLRPELVRHSRFRLPGRNDTIGAATDVHPWLIADAIRWYVEHPEHRAAIGTEAEHARLLEAVGASSYEPPRRVEEPPPALRSATHVAYAGVAFGVLTAALDVALIVWFSSRLKEHARIVGEREEREFGFEPVDYESGIDFAWLWDVMVLGLVAVAAVVALMAIRFLKRGNEAGRIALIVVSIAAAAWAVVPCFEIGFEAPAELMPLLLTVSVVKRLGYVGFGIATVVLLSLPSAKDFTRPGAPA